MFSTPVVAQAQSSTAAIPVRDLPPFPDVETEEDKMIGATVVSATEIEEDVVVGASKREQSLGSVASAVTVISGDRLRRFGARNLAEALSTVVGIYIVDDRMVSRVGTRGVQLLGDSNTRILILVDGSPLNEPWGQYVDSSWALPVNMDDVARVEIIRGPVSSIYGTNAFLGIVNIVTIEADKAPRAYGRAGASTFGAFSGNAGFGYGTVNRQVRGTVFFLNQGGESLSYADGMQGGMPITTDTDADGQQALNGSLSIHWDQLFFQFRAYDRARKLPGAPSGSLYGSDTNEKKDRHFLGEIGYGRQIGKRVTLALRAYANSYTFTNTLEYAGPMAGDPTDTFITEATALWAGGEVRTLIDILGDGKYGITVGVSSEWSRTESDSREEGQTGGLVAPINKDFNIQGAYLEASASPFKFASLTVGGRFDQNSLFESKLSPRAAALFQWKNRVGLKLLYTAGFRNPSIFEAHFSDGRLYLPAVEDPADPESKSSLRPESITSKEIVLWGRPFPGVNLRASYWIWDMEDMIEKGTVRDPATDEERLQFRNLAALQSTGFEVEGSYRDTRGWTAFANFTKSQFNKIVPFAADEPVPNSPDMTASVGVSTPALFDVVHVSTDVGYIGSRLTRDDDVEADPFIAWNLAIYVPNYKGFDFVLGVRNILGTREQIPAQSDYDRENDPTMAADNIETLMVPGPGREIFTRLGYRY